MEIKIKRLVPNASIPERATAYSAGVDLKACFQKAGFSIILPHSTLKVPTGIAVEIPEGCFGAIFARSGLASNKGLRPANCVGVIDSDYRGEIMVPLHNDTDISQKFWDGDRIAQLVIIPYVVPEFTEVDSLEETDRGEGGFGSTGDA